MNRLHTLGAVALLAALGACGGGDEEAKPADPTTSAKPTLKAAWQACASPLNVGTASQLGEDAPALDEMFRLEDDDTAILIDPPDGPFVGSLIYDAAVCVLNETKAPANVEQKLGASSASDGPQSATWDDITFEWSISVQDSDPALTASFVRG